jgi:primosomal protein N'
MDLTGAPPISRRLSRPRIETDSVEVLCDESSFVGSLSYKVPAGMVLRVGDAVRVPFGKREKYGMVVAPGDQSKATREVLECFGPRTGELEIALAAQLAAEQFCPFTQIAPRLAPRTKRGNQPLQLPPPKLRPGASRTDLALPSDSPARVVLALAPGVDPVRSAALEALRLAEHGQVLLLAPTKNMVSALLAEFSEGAARMDVVPKKNEPSAWRGFLEGSVPIAIATRVSALWPAKDLAGVVVLDENHPGHQESSQPYTNARSIAIRRTLAAGADLVLISSVPSLAALASRSKLMQAGSVSHWPTVRLVAKNNVDPFTRSAPPLAVSAISDAQRTRKGSFVLAPSNASRLRCRACRLVYDYPSTSPSDDPTASSPPSRCTRCGGAVSASGLGPERVRQLFPKATVLTFSELLQATPRPGSTVVILDSDSLAAAPDMEPSLTVSSALYAAARLAGPAGTVVVCSNDNPPEAVLDLLVKRDFRRHAKRVWSLAKQLSLPPFSRLLECRFQRKTSPTPPTSGCKVLGPKKVEDGEWELRLLVPDGGIEQLRPWVEANKRRGKMRLSVS